MTTGWKTNTGAILAFVGTLIGLIAPHLSDGTSIPWGEVIQKVIEFGGMVLGIIGIGHKLERIASK